MAILKAQRERNDEQNTSLQENKIHSSSFLYSSVPRNINGLYSLVLKPTNIGVTDERTGGDDCTIFIPGALFPSHDAALPPESRHESQK
jgi:hypothetical protein